MEKSNKRGKIPQSDWPSIMSRYEAGETLSSIARTYGCSPPAISYVVSRSRARQPSVASPPAPPTGAEPQLLKAAAVEPATGGTHPPSESAPAVTAAPDRSPMAGGQGHGDEHRPAAAAASGTGERREEMRLREANGFAGNGAAGPVGAAPMPASAATERHAATGSGNGDARRRLHLSLGSAPSGGRTPPGEAQAAERPGPAGYGQSARVPGTTERSVSPLDRDSQGGRRPPEAEAAGGGEAVPRDGGPSGHYLAMRPGNGDGADHRGAGSFIDRELRARVDGDIAAFLAAFDAALEEDTQESRSLLREATDRLLRAGARTRIELERLEARVPLAQRGDARRYEPAWRQR